MRNYQWLEEYCLNRFGSRQALESRLPIPRDPEQLRAMPDDRYLSQIALRVFRAGLKHSVVDARWPAFEEVFFGFDPEKVVLMSAEHIERLMGDKRLIRHLAKMRSVPRNAQMVLDLSREYGSMGALIADWPTEDIVGLWRLLARRGNQLGGPSLPLRMSWQRWWQWVYWTGRWPPVSGTWPRCSRRSISWSSRAVAPCVNCQPCWPSR